MVKFKCTDVSGSKIVQSQETDCTVKVIFRMEEFHLFFSGTQRRCIPLLLHTT